MQWTGWYSLVFEIQKVVVLGILKIKRFYPVQMTSLVNVLER